MTQTLVVLAAGLSSRFGSNKQLTPVGPNGEVLLDYAVYDAVRAGFENVMFVIRPALAGEFQNHVTQRFGKWLSVDFAFQDLTDVPSGFTVPETRVKPWGTAHAILSARHTLKTGFVVINADDFYGATAYSLLFEHLEMTPVLAAPEYAMVGYTLYDTFSEFGGVSRGVCELDEQEYLEKLVEVKNIQNSEGSIAGFDVVGNHISLNGNETVSMNIWGLKPAVFPILEQQFSRFLAESGHDPDAEFLISNALSEQIAAKQARLKVLQTSDQWLGMTFQQDRENVVRQLARLVQLGQYPDNLTSWFLEHR